MIDYRVYLVTDDPSRYRHDWLENIAAAIDGGVTCVQYRDTESSPDVRYTRLRRLQEMLKPRHLPLIVNNDAELAASVSAEGVHVGQNDLPPAQVRAIVGPHCEIGLSITDISQVAALKALPTGLVNSIGIGPIYDARHTKADASDAIGTEGLHEIVAATPEFPNCAIGGINLANAGEVISAGANGLAVVSAFSQSDDPYATAKNFRMLFDRRRV